MAERVTAAALAAMISTTAFAPATAQDAGQPKDLVEYRDKVMQALGNQASAAASLVKGKVDANHLQHHADAIATTAETVDDIWWDNSGPDGYADTRAKAKIWTQWDNFRTKIDEFQTAANDFRDAVEGG